MVTVTIAAIMMSMALSSWKSFVLDNRMVTQANEVITGFALSRSEAIKRSRSVTMCKSSDQATCVAAGSNWGIGWIVFVDDNNNGVVNGGEQLLHVHEQLGGSNTMNAGSRITAGITFTRFGLATFRPGTAGTDPTDRQFRLCDNRGSAFGRTLEISTTGRPTISRSC